MKDEALQDRIPHNHCFGCGPLNRGGLNLKSYWAGHGPSIARFSPAPHHCAGPRHFVNGGIIATLIDCHAICTAMAAAYFDEQREIGSHPARYFATGRLEIGYRRPAPIDAILELEAEIADRTDNGYIVDCRLRAASKLCAEGQVEAIAVSPEWMGVTAAPQPS